MEKIKCFISGLLATLMPQKSVLTLLLEIQQTMPHLMNQVLSYLNLQDLKLLSQVSKDLNMLTMEVYHKRRLKIINRLTQNGTEINDNVDWEGKSLLWKASKNGNIDLIHICLEIGAKVTRYDKYGFQPLHIATYQGHLNAVKFLIEHGKADIKSRTINTGKSALHLAAKYGHTDIVEFLISIGSNIIENDFNGLSPLHLATERGHINVIKVLIKNASQLEHRDHLFHAIPFDRPKVKADILKNGTIITREEVFFPMHAH